MKKVIKIDETGLFIEDVLINENEEIPLDCIETPCPNGFYMPKWNGAKWVEGLTQEEIDELNNQPRELTEIEIQQQIINTLGQEIALLKLQFMMGGM